MAWENGYHKPRWAVFGCFISSHRFLIYSVDLIQAALLTSGCLISYLIAVSVAVYPICPAIGFVSITVIIEFVDQFTLHFVAHNVSSENLITDLTLYR